MARPTSDDTPVENLHGPVTSHEQLYALSQRGTLSDPESLSSDSDDVATPTHSDFGKRIKKKRRQAIVSPITPPQLPPWHFDDPKSTLKLEALDSFPFGEFESDNDMDPYESDKDSIIEPNSKLSLRFLEKLRIPPLKEEVKRASNPDLRSPPHPRSNHRAASLQRVHSATSLKSSVTGQSSLAPPPKPPYKLLNPSNNHSTHTLTPLKIPSSSLLLNRVPQYRQSPTSALSDVYSEHSGNPLSTKHHSLPNYTTIPLSTSLTPLPPNQRVIIHADGGGEWRLVSFFRQEIRGRHLSIIEDRAWDYVSAEECEEEGRRLKLKEWKGKRISLDSKSTTTLETPKSKRDKLKPRKLKHAPPTPIKLNSFPEISS